MIAKSIVAENEGGVNQRFFNNRFVQDNDHSMSFFRKVCKQIGNLPNGEIEKMLAILRLYMGIGMKRRRKDFIYAKQIFELIGYFFEENNDAEEFKFDKDTVKEILKEYLAGYDHNDDNSAWFDKLKKVADNLSFASDMKAYKANPENYKGSISDIAEVVRIAVTGRANTPDLWTIIHIIGEDAMKAKIERLC